MVGADKKKWYRRFEHAGKGSPTEVHVFFLGEYNDAWVPETSIKMYDPSGNEAHYEVAAAVLSKGDLVTFQVGLFEANRRSLALREPRETANLELKLGSLVIAQLDVFPPWPARVERPEDLEETKMLEGWKNGDRVYCRFLGQDDTGSWVPLADIQPYTTERMEEIKNYEVHHYGKLYEELRVAIDQANGILRSVNSEAANKCNSAGASLTLPSE